MLKFLGGALKALVAPWLFVIGAFLIAGSMPGAGNAGGGFANLVGGFAILALAAYLGKDTDLFSRRRR